MELLIAEETHSLCSHDHISAARNPHVTDAEPSPPPFNGDERDLLVRPSFARTRKCNGIDAREGMCKMQDTASQTCCDRREPVKPSGPPLRLRLARAAASLSMVLFRRRSLSIVVGNVVRSTTHEGAARARRLLNYNSSSSWVRPTHRRRQPFLR